MTTQTSAQTKCAGISLFETLIVLALVALMATIAASAVRPGTSSVGLRHTAGQLVSDLKNARMQAMLIGAPVAVTTRENGYDIVDLDMSRDLPRNIVFKPSNDDCESETFLSGAKIIERDNEQKPGQDALEASCADAANQELIFDPQALASGTTLTLNDGKGLFYIDIAPITGEINARAP